MAYIKKEPIIEFITKGLNNPDKTKAFGYDAIEILTEIEYAPTEDVEEVKHGYWIGRLFQWGNEDKYPILEESNYLECSECGHLYYLCIQDFFGGLHKVPTRSGENVIPNGCPNCLAKMDGGNKND